MSILNNQRVIAIEEHYYDADVVAHFRGIDARTGGFVRADIPHGPVAFYEYLTS